MYLPRSVVRKEFVNLMLSTRMVESESCTDSLRSIEKLLSERPLVLIRESTYIHDILLVYSITEFGIAEDEVVGTRRDSKFFQNISCIVVADRLQYQKEYGSAVAI